MHILLLTLDTFSRTGGIQQFNRCLQLALCQYAAKNGCQLTHMSLNDAPNQLDARYGEPSQHFEFKGFAGNKLKFISVLLVTSHRFNLILFGHVNLVSLSLLPGLRYKDCRMIAHGVEVWSRLPFIKRRGLKKMNRIMAVSQHTSGIVHGMHRFPAEKIDFFPNCLDPYLAVAKVAPPEVWNKHWRIDIHRPYIVTLARLQPTEQAKGYDTLIKLLPRLAEKTPDVCYLLAGKSESSEYARIRQLAEANGVGSKVLMPGFVASEHLPALYSLARVFVMPSAKEGFGIVYLEAAWWGCPVVAYDAGGAKEALLNGELGTLVPAGDENALMEAISNKLSGPPLPETTKKEIREKITAHYGFGAFFSRLEKIIVDFKAS